MKHMRKERSERKNARKIITDVFITGYCRGRLKVTLESL